MAYGWGMRSGGCSGWGGLARVGPVWESGAAEYRFDLQSVVERELTRAFGWCLDASQASRGEVVVVAPGLTKSRAGVLTYFGK